MTVDANAFVQRWQGLYNYAAERMVTECHAEHCEVSAMGAGTFRGRDALAKVEAAVLRAAPQRFMRLDAVHVAGDAIIATPRCSRRLTAVRGPCRSSPC